MSGLAIWEARIAAMNQVMDAIEGGDRDDLGELRAMAAKHCHPELEWNPYIGGVEGRTYRGPEGMVSFYEDLLGSFEVRYADREFREPGDDAILLLWRMDFRGRESGIEFSREMAVIWEFEDDLIRRGRAYDSHAAAIADAETLDA